MPLAQSKFRKGYWWECDTDREHWEPNFAKIGKFPLVSFFYNLAESGWDQNRLSVKCPLCQSGYMRITYDFPRSVNSERLALIHVIGLEKSLPNYLPMLWESKSHKETEFWVDFKYVGWQENRGYQNYGLSRPAVFTKEGLEELFASYKRIVGRSLFNIS